MFQLFHGLIERSIVKCDVEVRFRLKQSLYPLNFKWTSKMNLK